METMTVDEGRSPSKHVRFRLSVNGGNLYFVVRRHGACHPRVISLAVNFVSLCYRLGFPEISSF